MESNLEHLILSQLAKGPIENTIQFAAHHKYDHNEVVGNLKSLDMDNYVELSQKENKLWVLTEEGTVAADKGSPEYRLYELIPAEGISKDELNKAQPEIFQFGFSNGMKKKWFKLTDGLVQKIAKEVIDDDAVALREIRDSKKDLPKEILEGFKKRKLIVQSVQKYFAVIQGKNFQTERKKKVADLTADMIAKESWKLESFKAYNFNALGKDLETGNLHPLLKVRTQFREILLEMGFEEMPTNNFVESSFWNFDSLFQPQQHPARDAHDTFFLADPAQSKCLDPEYWGRVKEMHEKGGAGSIGYRYEWSIEEAKKNIFRTHTTAVSARMLYKISQEKEFKPRKLFSIDRVFRNENLDATHLAEFHQIEGVIADRNIGLAHLKGVIREFFSKIGIKKLWFKPAFNPYTEPSMEIFGYHPILQRKVEIGNSGVFRPEMLAPMGLPKDVNVIAWGLSLERPTMIQYNVANIRELIGNKVNIKYVKENPICCFK